MVRAGEESGHLKDMLLRLADHQRSQEEISSKVRSAMTYPAFMLVIGISTVIFILTFVMPRLSGLFADLGQNLPWPTAVVLKLSAMIRAAGVWGLAAFAFLIMAISQWSKTQAGRVAISRVALSVPFLRTFSLKLDLARFCRTLALLLKSGLPIIRAIEIAVPTLNNNFIKRDILDCVQGLTAGQSLGACLKQSALIPEMMGQLITVGEESGSLTESLSDIADNYEQEIAESTKFMTTLLEPVMILSVGLVIGFIVFAMLLPIFQMDLLAR
jgi:type II secretory pathway component PulF